MIFPYPVANRVVEVAVFHSGQSRLTPQDSYTSGDLNLRGSLVSCCCVRLLLRITTKLGLLNIKCSCSNSCKDWEDIVSKMECTWVEIHLHLANMVAVGGHGLSFE